MLVYFMVLGYSKAIWYILCQFGTFCSNLVYFVAIWYILWLFGTIFPGLVCSTKKIWQPVAITDVAAMATRVRIYVKCLFSARFFQINLFIYVFIYFCP
jgi:hypothetical protein